MASGGLPSTEKPQFVLVFDSRGAAISPLIHRLVDVDFDPGPLPTSRHMLSCSRDRLTCRPHEWLQPYCSDIDLA